MTVEIIATSILEVINNGHVKEGSKKLEYEDILQLVYMARASAMRDQFLQDQQLGESISLSSMLSPYEIELVKVGNKKVAKLPGDIVSLPKDAGVFSVTPISGNGNDDSCQPIFPSMPGSEWAICKDDSGVAYYIPYQKEIHLFHLDDCVKKIRAVLVLNNEKSNVPDDVAWNVARSVLTVVLRTIAIPIDKTNDGNPNIDDALKTKLSAAQLNA